MKIVDMYPDPKNNTNYTAKTQAYGQLGSDPVGDFRDAMSKYGLIAPDYIEPGKLHRFPGEGKNRSNRAGWCVFFHDGTGGSFGDWSTGLVENWQAQREASYTAAERAEFGRKVAAARVREDMEKAAQHATAADNATALINASTPALHHPYLQAKRVLPVGILVKEGYLVIPMQDIDGKVWSVQSITSEGRKQFMSGGRVKDCFYLIGGPVTDQVFICEGFATGATLHLYGDQIGSKGQPVAVAFTTGNLKGVALAFRHKYPGITITIAADNDIETPRNPGLTKATEAAGLVNAGIISPDFNEPGTSGTDFNDYMNSGYAL